MVSQPKAEDAPRDDNLRFVFQLFDSFGLGWFGFTALLGTCRMVAAAGLKARLVSAASKLDINIVLMTHQCLAGIRA